MGITGFTVVVFIILIAVFGIIYFGSKKATGNRKAMWFGIPAILFAIWSLTTCWMWFYYFCLYLSLPALVISLVFFIIARSHGLSKESIRLLMILYVAIFLLTLASALFFNII